jgi:hypothetical protein
LISQRLGIGESGEDMNGKLKKGKKEKRKKKLRVMEVWVVIWR